LPQQLINKAVKHSTKRLNACKKASSAYFKFSQSLTIFSLCCLTDNVFPQRKHDAPFVLHTFCCTWTWKMTLWLQKKFN